MRLLLRLAEGKEKAWGRSCRWDAIKLALAYGIGKPREAVEITTEERPVPIDLTGIDEEHLIRLAGMAHCPAECCSVQKSGKPSPILEIPSLDRP